MKERVIVKRGEYKLFDGNILELPLKDEYITKLSIKIFDDDDPCIIHQSYVIKEMVTGLLDLFKSQNKSILKAVDFEKEFDIVDFSNLFELTFELLAR